MVIIGRALVAITTTLLYVTVDLPLAVITKENI